MASIVKIKQGVWRATVSYQLNGKRHRASKYGFAKQSDAKQWANDYEQNIQHGSIPSSQSLADYFLNWYRTYKTDITDISLDQYHQAYLAIQKFAPLAMLKDFDRNAFQNLINAYAEHHAKTSVIKRKGEIQAALKDAYADGLIDKDPTVRITVTGHKSKPAEAKFLEADDFLALENYVYPKIEIKSYMGIFIALHTGLRAGEIRGLKFSDVDFDHSTLSVKRSIDVYGRTKKPKTKSSIRTIKIDDKLLQAFNLFKDEKSFLIDVTDGALNKTLRYALKELDAKKITFHGLRHSHASYLLSKGISIQYVSERLGHANIAITQKVYAHLLQTKRLEEETKTVALMSL